MQDDPSTKRSQALMVIIAIAILAMVGYYAFITLGRNGKAAVVFTTAPQTAKVTVDGKTLNSRSTYLSPGSHEVSAVSNGFVSSKKTIEVQKDRLEVSFVLSPESSDARAYVASHQPEFLRAEAIAGQTTQEEGLSFENANPIVKRLPYHSLLLDIDYRASKSNPNRISLIVTAFDSKSRSYALSLIRSWGYEPSDYEIVFENFVNALGGG